VLAELCEKAYELGSKAPAGYDHAVAAMRLLAQRLPEKERACWEKRLQIAQRRYARATRFARVEAGEHILILLIRRAEKAHRAGDYDEALLLLRKAFPVARAIRSPTGRDVLAMQKYLAGRSRFAGLARAVEARLKGRPDDRASRQTAIRLYLTELDLPQRAAALLTPDVDEATRTYLPLVARPVDQLDPNVCVELGSWYRSLAARASPDGKLLCAHRAARYCRHAAGKLAPGGIEWTRARLALQDLNAALAGVRNRYPFRPATSALRSDLLARGRARNRLPTDLQVELLQRDFARTNPKARIRVHFRPDTDGEIHRVDLRGARGLVSLEFLAALPLTSLDLSECSDLRGDLSALAGMPLQNLTLSECAALKSLHGLEDAPLASLDLTGCSGLENVEALKGMPLRSLALSPNPAIRGLSMVRDMPLTSLRLVGFGGLRDLRVLAGTKVTSLSLAQCGVETFEGVEGLKLTRLSLEECHAIRRLDALKGQDGIGSLNLAGCGQLESLAGLEGLPLKKLSLAGCRGLAGDLSVLERAQLTSLNLTNCSGLTSLKGIEKQPLEDLTLAGCSGLESLAGIERLPIAELSLAGCTQLPDDLTPLGRLPLTSLDLTGCTNLTSLSGVKVTGLRTLVLQRCSKLTGDLSALAGARLVELDLSDCTALASLAGIESLRLQTLDLTGCRQLRAADYERVARIPTLQQHGFRPGSRTLAKCVYAAMRGRQKKKPPRRKHR